MKIFTIEDLIKRMKFEIDDEILHEQAIKAGIIPPDKPKREDIEKLKADAMKESFMNPPENDNVNHPDHYISGMYETIDVIEDWLTPEQFVGFCLGNSLKYLSRWQDKGGVEDLEKAAWYLNYIIEDMNRGAEDD